MHFRTSTFIIVALVAVLWAETAWFRQVKSITFDETYYLNCGLQTVHDGTLDRRISAEGIGPLPILLTYVPALWFAPREARLDPWRGEFHDPQLIDGPRLANVLVSGIPLIVVVFVWFLRRRGLAAAAVAGSLLALSPTIVAHCALATMDASFALFAMLAIAAAAWYLQAPSGWRLSVWAAAIAAAMTAKYSGVFLLPTAALLLAMRRMSLWREPRACLTALRQSALTFVALLGLVLPIWWGLHLFTYTGPLKNVSLADTPDESPYVRLLGRGPLATWFMDVAHRKLKRPAPVAGVVFQYLHNETGHDAFLMGDHSKTGWWYYFPCVFGFKSTPVELLLAALIAVALLVAGRHPLSAWERAGPSGQALLVAAAVYVAMVLTARINIGHRYLIVLYPCLIVAGVDRLAGWLQERPGWFVVVGTLLVLGQLASNFTSAPHFLAYFNRLCGGPERGWQLLVDSSLDWGQDLPSLREELRRLGGGRCAIQYFGTARPEAYGVQADPLSALPHPPETYEYVAISATFLQGQYLSDRNTFGAFRLDRPDARAGHSIFIYRLDTPARQAAFRAAAEAIAAPRIGCFVKS